MSEHNKSKNRGVCPECLFSHRLRKSGLIGSHYVYHGNRGVPCWGSGKEPARPRIFTHGPIHTIEINSADLAELKGK